MARDRKKPLATVGARWAIEPRVALVDRGAQHVAMAAGCRGFGRDLGGGDDWRGLRLLGAAGRALGRRDAPVKVAVGSALSGVREKVC